MIKSLWSICVRSKAQLVLILVSLLAHVAAHAQQKAEIIWDDAGVPHIYAKDLKQMYRAFGWSQMQNHGDLILRLYGQARGRAAEYWGERFVASDRQVHLFELPLRAEQQYAQQGKDYKALLDAFVEGVNAYAKAHPDSLDDTMELVLPITPQDVLAHVTRVISLEFLAGSELRNTARMVVPGSNAYAIAPSRTKGHNAMLVANPHLPWSDVYMFFEAHLNAPGFNAYGAALVGQPVLNIAFNQQLGWTHTVNTIDAVDRYEITMHDSAHYLLDDRIIPFKKKNVAIKVRAANDEMRTVNTVLTWSQHGPVIGSKNGKAYALRIAGMENARLAEQYHRMASAKDLTSFLTAVRMLQLPMFNILYADNKGHILYVFNGTVPVRKEGDWNFWSGTIPGNSSKWIWNKYHKFNDLPMVLDPRSGFLQNANDPPWYCTYPQLLRPERFPSYLSPLTASLRAQRSVKMMMNEKDLTLERLQAIKMDTRVEAADRLLDDLISIAARTDDSLVRAAVKVLSDWDRHTDSSSRGAVLFDRWYSSVDTSLFQQQWITSDPMTTPSGLRDNKKAINLLRSAAKETHQMYGSLDVSWGKVNRFKLGRFDLAGNGGPSAAGVYRSINFNRNPVTNIAYANQGDSYVALVEFGKTARAKLLLSYGNASQRRSLHLGDQLRQLSEKRLRDALLTKEDVILHMTRREVIQ